MKNLLLELGVEELPAKFIVPAVNQLRSGLAEGLQEHRVEFQEIAVYSSPRRLAAIVMGVQEKQQDVTDDVKGPPKSIAFCDGEPTKAALGFAKSQGMNLEALQVKKIGGAEYLFAEKHQPGQPTAHVLVELLPELVSHLSFPKTMRWGNNSLRFARPLRWIVALWGGEVIPFCVEDLQSGRCSYGHRQLACQPIDVVSDQSYVAQLREAYVVVETEKRKASIEQQVRRLADEAGGHWLVDHELLDEVTNLVEYPTAFVGRFDEEFLAVPKEVLITTMKEHQRYFSVVDDEGRLLPIFIGVRNGADNHLPLVAIGNERVLRARLADAKFFWDEDRRQPLAAYVDRLKTVVFQEGLGTVYDKAERVRSLAGAYAELLDLGRYAESAKRTALLAKADLTTHMVFEFPELQGIMGREYALLSGEDEEVAMGIREHYRPRFAGDEPPSNIPGVLVGLADKLDTLVGYFGIGKAPTGSQDPFALRRQALGVVQTLLMHQFRVSLDTLMIAASQGYRSLPRETDQIHQDLRGFFRSRIRRVMMDNGFRYDTVDAVLAGESDDVLEIRNRIAALEQFREEQPFADLMTAFERAANLSSKATGQDLVSEALTDDDVVLLRAMEKIGAKFQERLDAGDARSALHVLAALREPVDQFFDAVLVMDKDEVVRGNRLQLLKRITDLFARFGDLRLIVRVL